MPNREELDLFRRLEYRLAELTRALGNTKIVEYVEFLNNRRKMFYNNFLAGMARGLGMAVGFTILGAIFIYLLKWIVLLNLPLISDFIADLIQLVQDSLRK